ncbi:hypothetical protein PHSY_004523 [Pseudozyma hubeiensis SY62]|uniref:Hemimethylated DNA-binding domain-containing protein n=1 Tax=Pseudozyma hubeiensis (strain SY62) TaxID=1305764 RepID=R9P6H7_PSEHS|nr:hypothetical protein PHSY_004523 [Pseudozyma hubeiensis SY62]GAC96939.1 hypothetical protein PHSY_004523 [Pseudozyma hubeiensis SY62]
MAPVLPDEVVYHIFTYLEPHSLGITLQCSTAFYRIATAPPLWEVPYFLRWTTGDPRREAVRGTDRWKRYRKLRRLAEHATRAAEEKGMKTASTSQSPFHYLNLDEGSVRSATSAPSIDFYRLFLERIRIDQEVLDSVYDQVEATHDRIPPITSLARRFGNDAKDVLTAVVEAQSSCPSWACNGLPHGTETKKTHDRGKLPETKDALAYNTDGYRISAYQAHLPTSLRSETHHLVILHHAREILEHLQRREAMQGMSDMAYLKTVADTSDARPRSSRTSHDFLPKQTERAVSLLTMFRGGEVTYVEEQLDILAAACDLYLQQRLPPTIPATSSTLETAKLKATAICDFLADHGFRGARDDLFHDLDNHFLHHCFTTNRETLPLSLTLIFCGIANRLGLTASLCNFPMRIIAFISTYPTAPLPSSTDTLESAHPDLFWLDVCEYTTVAYDAHEPTPTDPFARKESWLQQRPPILDRNDLTEWIGRMGVPPSDDFWRPAEPGVMAQRAARNIFGSVQRAQITPRNQHPVGQARSALRAMELNRRRARLEQQWKDERVDYAFLNSMNGRTDPRQQRDTADRVAAALAGKIAIDEDETIWHIVKSWRRESMPTLISQPDSWVLPAQPPSSHFRSWMAARADDNDWTLSRIHLQRRADHWSEHERQAAKYAALNAFLRINAQMIAREVDWFAGFVQSYFMLDVEVVERDFLGMEHGEDGERLDGGGGGAGSEEEGSESSDEEEGISIRGVRDGGGEGGGILTNANARVVLGRMLQAVRVKDGEAPRINRRAQKTTSKRSSPSPAGLGEDQVAHRVGTVFRHRTYRYAGSILGWDPHCAAPEDWIVNMGVDRLPSSHPTQPGGRHQPFYHSQVADGTRRYVAEVNVEPIRGPIWIYGLPSSLDRAENGESVVEEAKVLGNSIHRMLQLRGLGEYFRCFDQRKGRLRKNADARVMFPDDVSDDEDEEGDAMVGGDEEEDVAERLSEDASW